MPFRPYDVALDDNGHRTNLDSLLETYGTISLSIIVDLPYDNIATDWNDYRITKWWVNRIHSEHATIGPFGICPLQIVAMTIDVLLKTVIIAFYCKNLPDTVNLHSNH